MINVCTGEMSLVGPRPALRVEVDALPVALRRRHRVAASPALAGRGPCGNPAFDAYQRLDLFDVENWRSPSIW